jgi:hypothetical protein
MASPTKPRTPCWNCKHMISVEPRSTIVQCGLNPAIPRCFSRGGSKGCDFWEREPGIDDDDWDPAGLSQIAPYAPEAPRVRSRGADGWWTKPPRPRRPPPVPVPVRMPTGDPFGGIYLGDD